MFVLQIILAAAVSASTSKCSHCKIHVELIFVCVRHVLKFFIFIRAKKNYLCTCGGNRAPAVAAWNSKCRWTKMMSLFVDKYMMRQALLRDQCFFWNCRSVFVHWVWFRFLPWKKKTIFCKLLSYIIKHTLLTLKSVLLNGHMIYESVLFMLYVFIMMLRHHLLNNLHFN